MIHPSSSEDESDPENPVKEEPAPAAATVVLRKNSVRSQAKSDSSASFPESSHSSIRVPSPSPSTTSEENDAKSRQQEAAIHDMRLLQYVFCLRCIAYPCFAKQPNDLPKRDFKLKKDQLHRIRNDCQVCLAEKAKSKPDEVFRNALSSFSKNILNTPRIESLVLAGGCTMGDLRDKFRPYLAIQPYLKVLDRKDITKNEKFKFLKSSMARFDALLCDDNDDLNLADNADANVHEAISTKEQLYDMLQNVLGIKKSERQILANSCQLENLDEQAAAVRRELRVRMLVPDLIAEHGKYPDFFIQPGQSEATVRQRYLNELRVEANDLMSALDRVPLSSKSNNGKSSGSVPKLRKLQLSSIPSTDHSTEEETPLSKSDVILQFPYEIVVVEVQGIKSVAPNRQIYCTMEVGGSREKLQTELVPVSKPLWESQGDFTSTHPLCVIKVKLFVKNTGMLAIEDKELGRANLLWTPGFNNSKLPQWYNMIVPKNTPDQLRIKLSVYMERPLNMKQSGYLWAQSSSQWKVWKKRFFLLVQVSQCNFALCSYVERRTEPTAMIPLNGYIVNYSPPNDRNNKLKLFFKMTKENQSILLASEDRQEGAQWIQAIFRATGQNIRPTPLSEAGAPKSEDQLGVPPAWIDVLSDSNADKIASSDPCKFDHANFFEDLQRRTLLYRLNDPHMNMGNFTPGQAMILDEYCIRFGVREIHRRLCLLSALLDQADRGLIVDAQLLRYNYLVCAAEVTGRQLNSSGAPPIITIDEMVRFRLIKKRLENYIVRQITCFWYCFPFGRPKGNLKSTLLFLNVFKQDVIPDDDRSINSVGKNVSKSNHGETKLTRIKSEDKSKSDGKSKISDKKTSVERNEDDEEEIFSAPKSEMRLVVNKCFKEGANVYYKRLIQKYNVSASSELEVEDLVQAFVQLSEEAGEALYVLKRDYAREGENHSWFSCELFTYCEAFLALLNNDLEKLLQVQQPTEFQELFRIFTNLARIFKTSKLWKGSGVRVYLYNMFTPVLVNHFDAAETSIKNAIAKDCSMKAWKSSNVVPTTRAALAILNRLETVITFLRELDWTDMVYVNSVEHVAKSIAASLIQEMLESILQRFMDQKNSLRSSLDMVITAALMEFVNYAILAKECIVKLCGAGRDFSGRVKFYHVDLEISVNETLKTMTLGIVDKFDQVLKECVLDRLSRYDDGTLTAGIMRMAMPGLEMVTGYMTFVSKNQEALLDGISDYSFVLDLMTQWYEKGLQRHRAWLEARKKINLHQLKASIVFVKKFSNEFATQGLQVYSSTYKAILNLLDVEETHASLVNNSLGDGVTIKDAVEDEKKRSEKKKADMEAAMKINVETAEAAASSEHDSVSNEQSDEKSEVLTPKSKRKGFSFKVPVKKNK